MIDLDNMTITFQKPGDGGVFLVGLLRRLSTVSYMHATYSNPRNFVFTKWKWYWQDDQNIWHWYDCSERDIQKQLEAAFLYKYKIYGGKARSTYKLTTSGGVYGLFLHSTSEMYLVDLKTGTKRQLKRRPVEPVSNEDLDEGVYGDSSVKRKKKETAVNFYVPSHWSSMPPNAQYTRVRLDTTSAEFKDVEELFRKTMNDHLVIASIERVQNPLVWEKYLRNKENMMAVAQLNQHQVDEKRLFHGTRQENVEAICGQNFDPRLSSRGIHSALNGTYFAVHASSSDKYATRDVDFSQFMFLAKVLLGSHTEDGTWNPRQYIHVIYETDHFYPEYIIKYSRTPPAVTASNAVKSSISLGTAITPSRSSAQRCYSVASSVPTSVHQTGSSTNLDF
ncbi:protein mono-ADP-ribosyltransferase PARP11-like [Oculina patagonica]